jgi:aryl-alcohol dehydrogenase-like predicted oxidoreductase
MKYRKLGRSGLDVSEISLGSWMTVGGSLKDETSAAIIHKAYELGINFFDTANAYNEGRAEEILGTELSRYDRRKLVVGTKVYWDSEGGPNYFGLSRKHIFESCDASLARLRMDYMDIMQCHRYDEGTPLLETLRALDDLQAMGKVLYAGISCWSAAQIDEARSIGKKQGFRPLISDQPCYNLLNRGDEAAVQPACEAAGMGWVIFSPLAQGTLTGKYSSAKGPKGSRATDPKRNMWLKPLLNPAVLSRVAGLKKLAKEKKMTPGQMALAWTLSNPIVASAIVGATSAEQLEENAAASGKALDAATLAKLNELFPREGVK